LKPYLKALLLLLLLLASSAQAKDIEIAWEKAKVYTPTDSNLTTTSELELNGSHPALIYLHGCTGITGHDISWAKLGSSKGFLVIMPDSMARPNRESNCDPK
jgi:poly(3-hydroxybutyrate) depolymerase